MADYWITLVTPKLIHVSKTRTDPTLGSLILGLCWVQLTETKTNASNSSGDLMTAELTAPHPRQELPTEVESP